MSDAHNPGGELHPPHPPTKAREEGFDLLYLWVITPRSGLQVKAQGGPGESSHSAGERLGSQLPASGKVSLRWGFESHGPFFHYYCSKIYITQKNESHSVVSNSLQPHGLYSPWNSLGQNTGVGSLSLLQGIFPTQGSNPGFRHCRWILYQLSHKGSPHNANCTVSTMSKYPSQWH